MNCLHTECSDMRSLSGGMLLLRRKARCAVVAAACSSLQVFAHVAASGASDTHSWTINATTCR